jgi:hypothetical protein
MSSTLLIFKFQQSNQIGFLSKILYVLIACSLHSVSNMSKSLQKSRYDYPNTKVTCNYETVPTFVKSFTRHLLLLNKKGRSHPCNKPWRPIGLRDVKDPIFSRQLVQLEGLSKMKREKTTTSSGIEPATFRLITQCLNQLHYSVFLHSFQIFFETLRLRLSILAIYGHPL